MQFLGTCLLFKDACVQSRGFLPRRLRILFLCFCELQNLFSVSLQRLLCTLLQGTTFALELSNSHLHICRALPLTLESALQSLNGLLKERPLCLDRRDLSACLV